MNGFNGAPGSGLVFCLSNALIELFVKTQDLTPAFLKSILVQKENYLLELARYVVLNPVRAGMVRTAKDWPWSSYRATTGVAVGPAWLNVDGLLSVFSRSRHEAIAAYRAFVADGKGQPSPWDKLRNQIYLGDEVFVEELQAIHAELRQEQSEIPAIQRQAPAKSLSTYKAEHKSRDDAITAAYASRGYTLADIGEFFGLHYSRVSRIIKSQRKAKGKT